MLEAGKILQNRYRIQKQIGQGGMGAVYVATDERFGSTVAVKETLVLESQFRKAIEREARLLNSLKHPALPRVTDHFADDDGQFIVMEYIAGSDLSEMMEQSGKPFAVAQVLDWANQLLDALDFLHTQETPVIHRDIKPQNLKLTPQGKIILLDFGLAKGNPTDAEHQTAAKSIFGYSRSYASLEQIQGTGTDPRSDLYSLAAALYHLLTGILPEDALTRAMHVLSDREDTLRPVNLLNPEIPRGIAGVLRQAMSLNANQRPSSAREMRQMFAESEKYADTGEAKTLIGSQTRGFSAAQTTNPMPGAFNNQTDVQTKILSGEDLSARQIKISADTDPQEIDSATKIAVSNPKKRPVFAAVGLAAALLAGGGLAAVYFHKPETQTAAPTVEQNKTAANNVADTETAISSNAANNTVDETAKTKIKLKVDTNVIVKTADLTKTAKTAGSGKNSAAPTAKNGGTTDEDADDEDKTIYVGNMKISKDRVETPDTIIDENGIHPKTPPRPPRTNSSNTNQKRKLKKIVTNQDEDAPDN